MGQLLLKSQKLHSSSIAIIFNLEPTTELAEIAVLITSVHLNISNWLYLISCYKKTSDILIKNTSRNKNQTKKRKIGTYIHTYIPTLPSFQMPDTMTYAVQMRMCSAFV